MGDISPALASLSTGKNHYYDRFLLGISSLVFLSVGKGAYRVGSGKQRSSCCSNVLSGEGSWLELCCVKYTFAIRIAMRPLWCLHSIFINISAVRTIIITLFIITIKVIFSSCWNITNEIYLFFMLIYFVLHFLQFKKCHLSSLAQLDLESVKGFFFCLTYKNTALNSAQATAV